MKKLLASILMGVAVYAVAFTPLSTNTIGLAQAQGVPQFGTGVPEDPTQPMDAPGADGGTRTSSGNDAQKKEQELTNANEAYERGQSNFDGSNARAIQTALYTTFACPIISTTNCTGDTSNNQLTVVKNLFVALYTPPATTGTYIADLMDGAGLNIAKPAYAQGIGFAALDPILDTWKVFRNVAYLFYVLLFLVIGFMIMFRQKISSQAVVTAQQALPKIIVSLLAVTFSYAIAGLLIDMMFLSMYLLIGLFPNQTFGPNLNSLRSIALDGNVFQIATFFLFDAGGLSAGTTQVAAAIDSMFGSYSGAITDIVSIIGGVTFAIIFSIAVLFGLFRLFFELLTTYLSIVLAIVMSPLALMLGALPGNNAFQSWIKSLVANLAVFPGIMLVIIIGLMLIGNGESTTLSVGFQSEAQRQNGGFVPPYLPIRDSANSMSILLGLAVILILPDIAKQIKSALGGKGGIIEQFANNFTSALKKGWEGGELIPGLGFTDTSKFPLGGLTGKNFFRKEMLGGAYLGGLAAGGVPVAAGKVLSRAERGWRGMRRVDARAEEEGRVAPSAFFSARPYSFREVRRSARERTEKLGSQWKDPTINSGDKKKSGH